MLSPLYTLQFKQPRIYIHIYLYKICACDVYNSSNNYTCKHLVSDKPMANIILVKSRVLILVWHDYSRLKLHF